MLLDKYIDIKPEVKQALDEGRPVVALESTIISHGMPYPKNVSTAKNVEKIIRDKGAVPATIAIIDGIIKIGLTDDELEYFGKADDILKVSRRDLAVVISNKLSGATTVATTMICAALADIKVFVTGGIGGVHRGATDTMDVSADLEELANTNVAVVCAGAKSILDIGLTLEYLETHGVPVLSYGTEEFPAFYSDKSGFKSDYMVTSADEIADIMVTKWDLGLKGGIVIANPIPKEVSMDPEVINSAIDKALEEADSLSIKGKEITPFILDKVKQITSGTSLEANIELVYNNARLGAEIALQYYKR
ncbi:MAG: pseudouridine-5-phosphate glycosidase [Clostridiales bacterium]|nr:MAG: pseudouridine-5-phosphate glycosidase [Clostridiales bacterium]